MKAIKKSLIIHPFLLAVYQILFLFSNNIQELPPGVMVVPMLVTILSSLLFFTLLYFALRDWQKSGFIVSLSLLYFFSYGHLLSFAKELVYVISILALILIFLILRTTRSLKNVTKLLNISAAALVAISLIQIAVYTFQTRVPPQALDNMSTQEKVPPTKGMRDELPNIFFIILDGYARADVLSEIYQFDNTDFLNSLTDKGFFVANQARANYSQTSLTLASCLNMKYLDDLVAGESFIEANDRQPLAKMINQSLVGRFLKQRGYKTVAFSSGVESTEIRNADLYLKPGGTLNAFQNSLINTTPIPGLLEVFAGFNQYDMHRKNIHFTLDRLPKLAKLNHPLFVFAHLEVPHPPFVFGPNGEKRQPEQRFDDFDGNWLINEHRLTRRQYITGYVDQLVYINKKITAVIDGILTNSKVPPVIILFSDHGPRSMLVWEQPAKTYMKECMSILNAYYLPPDGQSHLYDEISPINTFPIVLNLIFSTDYEILEDASYFSTPRHMYRFFDVTSRIKKPRNELVHYNLGVDFSYQGDFSKAIYHLLQALKINNDFAEAHTKLSYVYSKQSQHNKAINHLRKAIQLRPENEILHNELGISYLRIQNLDEAIVHYREAIRIKSDYVPAHINLGNALAHQGRLQEAIEHYTTALRIEPDLAETYNNLGVAYARQGKFTEAKTNFSEALRLDPEHVRAQKNLKIVLQKAHKAAE